jgi:cell division protein FtsW (lipid II flippase)
MITKQELHKLWSDPENWRRGVVYWCSEDPRIIVPKQAKWTGYTMNFCHRKAYWALLAIIVALLAPFFAPLVFRSPTGVMVLTVSFILILIVLICLCHWESHRER